MNRAIGTQFKIMQAMSLLDDLQKESELDYYDKQAIIDCKSRLRHRLNCLQM